jgi:hypothetical protein
MFRKIGKYFEVKIKLFRCLISVTPRRLMEQWNISYSFLTSAVVGGRFSRPMVLKRLGGPQTRSVSGDREEYPCLYVESNLDPAGRPVTILTDLPRLP